MISSIISRLVILLFGTLYPAYASYKAVRTKNVKEYVKWMMYWIVFALFTCIETFTDVFLSWFPFYYEIKIVLVIWLLSPATKGSSILYRKFVHPTLSSREQEIDQYINKAKEQSYKQVLDLGSKGMSALMQTALKGGGGLVSQLRKSYSLTDLTDTVDSSPMEVVRRRRPAGRSPGRSATASAIYFSEMDVRMDGATGGPVQSVLSAEDISSGYSSAEGLYAAHSSRIVGREPLHRTSSLTRSRTTRVTRSTAPKTKIAGSDDSDNENEVFDTNIIFVNDRAKKIDRLAQDRRDSSSSENEFFETADLPHGKPDCLNNLNSSTVTACHDPSDNLDVPTAFLSRPLSVTGADNITEEKPLNILNITKDVDTFSSYIQNLIDVKAGERERTNSTSKSRTTSESERRDSESNNCDSTNDNEARGGKYRKKAAPLPPQQKTTDASAIKATLILQPGLVKTVGATDSKEIFLQSPKSKRKKPTRSPSSASTGQTKNKMEALGKMMRLPKKLGHISMPKIGDKRLSWHIFHKDVSNLLDGKIQSKSDNNIPEKLKENFEAKIELSRSGSHLSVRSLTDSPLAHRRLKIIRRYVDEDID